MEEESWGKKAEKEEDTKNAEKKGGRTLRRLKRGGSAIMAAIIGACVLYAFGKVINSCSNQQPYSEYSGPWTCSPPSSLPTQEQITEGRKNHPANKPTPSTTARNNMVLKRKRKMWNTIMKFRVKFFH